MTKAFVVFVEFLQSDASTSRAKYQNFWPGETVDNATFYPFTVTPFVSSLKGEQNNVTVTFALTADIEAVIAGTLNEFGFVLVQMYSYSSDISTAPRTLVASHIGELTSAQQVSGSISAVVGTSLDSLFTQVPARKFTSSLIGEPPIT